MQQCWSKNRKTSAPQTELPKIAKGMSILRGLAVGRIDLDLELFACVLHGSRQLTAWRKIVVVFGLEEENRRARIADCASHQCLNFGCIFPALSGACRINCRAV